MFLPRVSATTRINLGMLAIVSGLVAVAPYVPSTPPVAHAAPTVCARPLGQGWEIVATAELDGVARPSARADRAAPCP